MQIPDGIPKGPHDASLFIPADEIPSPRRRFSGHDDGRLPGKRRHRADCECQPIRRSLCIVERWNHYLLGE
jgi:hypothetical protein